MFGSFQNRVFIAVFAWLLQAAIGPPLAAATWTVCPAGCDASTLQGGVALASPGDTLELLTTAPYVEHDIVITKSVRIVGLVGLGGGIRAAATQGTAPGRVFTILPGVFVRIEDLDISFGNADRGGAILNQGVLLLERVTLHHNDAAGEGGALFNDVGATARLRDCEIFENAAGSHGGAIENHGGLTVEGCSIHDEVAAGNGGGIRSTAGFVELRGTRLYQNQAQGDRGGAISIEGGGLEITNSSLYANSTSEDGGGLFVGDGARSTIVSYTTIAENRSHDGAGVYVASTSAPRLHAVTIFGNRAASDGGGIYVRGGSQLSLSSVTVAGNAANSLQVTAGRGGGLRLGTECSPSPCFPSAVILENSLVSDNLDHTNPAGADCVGTLSVGGHNLIGVGSTGLSGDCRVEGDLTGLLLNVAGGTGGFDSHGGVELWGGYVPRTLSLDPASLAIDAGDPADCVDALGRPRVIDQRYADNVGICDLGAFEFGGVPLPPMPPFPQFQDGFESGGTHYWSEASP